MVERFRVETIERGNIHGMASYILRGSDALGRPAVFNVPCKSFPQCEGVFGREPGTEIIKSFDAQGRVTGIKIVLEK